MSLSGKEISLAYYVKKVNERLGKSKDIVESVADNASDLALKVRDALFEAGIDLAEMIQLSLMSKENLRSADEFRNLPHLLW